MAISLYACDWLENQRVTVCSARFRSSTTQSRPRERMATPSWLSETPATTNNILGYVRDCAVDSEVLPDR